MDVDRNLLIVKQCACRALGRPLDLPVPLDPTMNVVLGFSMVLEYMIVRKGSRRGLQSGCHHVRSQFLPCGTV